MNSSQERSDQELKQMDKVARSFNTAMKGAGTDEERIIRELVTYNTHQRQLIQNRYLAIFGHTLIEDLQSELSGYFLKAAVGLLTPHDEYEARLFRRALKGSGTDDRRVIELLCPKDAHEVEDLKAAYLKIFKRDLGEDIKNEESGDLARVLRSIASGYRSMNNGFDPNEAKQETETLYDAGEGKNVGTDESQFIRVLCSKSFPELNAIFANYKALYDRDIEVAVNKEFSGDLLNAMMTIVKAVRSKPRYYAELVHNSVKGAGTNETDLEETLIRRSSIDLHEVIKAYKEMYNKDLEEVIKDETGGDLQRLLVALVGKAK